MKLQQLTLIILIITLSTLGSYSLQISPTPKNMKLGNQDSTLAIKEYQFLFVHRSANQRISEDLILDHRNMLSIYSDRLKTNENGQIYRIEVLLEKIDSAQDYTSVSIEQDKYEIQSSEKLTIFKCSGYFSFLRALETFTQMANQLGQNGILSHLPISIQDEPSYAHRGLLMDTSRYFFPIEAIERTIRGMQISKFNILHWHITDSESFPYILLEQPEVTQYGAYGTDETYWPTDINILLLYALQRGVVIIPEFDSPAHTRSWALAPNLQELNACYGYPPADWGQYCLEPPCGQLDVTLNKTYDLVQKVITNVQKAFTSTYIHLGGDEVIAGCWDYRPSIKEWMKDHNISDYNQLENYYFFKISKFLDSNRKKIFWYNDQQVNLTYPPDSVIQYWADSKSYAQIQNRTEPVILSTYDYLYLDCGAGNQLGGGSWCDPYKTWLHVYEFQPKDSKLGDRLLGAEAVLWSEMISPAVLDQKAWPRASSLALRLWNEDENLNLPDLASKLIYQNYLLKQVGIAPGPVSDEYCEKHVDMCFFK